MKVGPTFDNGETLNITSQLINPMYCNTLFFIDVEMFDFSLLRSVPFDLVALLSMLIMLAYFIPFAFSSVRAETMGMEPHKAAFLISILGKIDSKAFET